ncbi:hypothetical protein JCM6882_009333 [Rhodosporidiobolus microsporus]
MLDEESSRAQKGRQRARKAVSCEERLCTWDSNAAAPLYERREANETRRLRSEVDRLQRLVDILISFHPPEAAPAAVPSLPPPPEDLATEDLAQSLSQLTLKTFEVGSSLQEDESGKPLVNQARQLLNTADPPPFSFSNPSDGKAFTFPPDSPLSLRELTGRVPPRRLVEQAVEGHFSAFAWFIHPITCKQYQHHQDLVFAAKDTDEPAPAISLALVFAIAAHGLYSCDPATIAYSNYDKDGVAAQFVELARDALQHTAFVEQPTLDSIRVLVLLTAHYTVCAPGDLGSRGVSLLARAANACLQLGLHRDPDERPNNLSLAEKEDRRRLWWTTVVLEVLLTSILGRRYSLLHTRTSTTRLPLDIHDAQLNEDSSTPTGEQTHMSSLLVWMRFAQLSEQITDEVFGIAPISYSRVLEIDRQLRRFQQEDDEPDPREPGEGEAVTRSAMDRGNPTIRVLHEILRIHRPYLLRSYTDEKYTFSRTTCLETARQILRLHTSPLLQGTWPCVSYETIVAAVTLCVDLLLDRDSADKQCHCELVIEAAERLEKFRTTSTICRRGAALIRFLLVKIDSGAGSFRPTERDPPLSKRTRMTASSSASSVAASYPEPTGDAHLPHKLPHGASLLSIDSSTSPDLPASLFPVSSCSSSALTSAPPRRVTHPFRSNRPDSGSPSLPSSVGPPPPTVPSAPLSSNTSSFSPPTSSEWDTIASLDFPALFGRLDEATTFDFEPPGNPCRAKRSEALSDQPQVLETEDLVKRLAGLTFTTYTGVQAQQLLESAAPTTANTGTGIISSTTLFLGPTPTTLSLQELTGRVPPKNLIDKAVQQYFATISWYLHPITNEQYLRHDKLVFAAKSADQAAPALSLAIVFALSALGLFGGDFSAPAYANYEQDHLARALVDLARQALAHNNFVEHPTLDSLRVLSILGTHFVVGGPGEHGRHGIAMYALAANACLQLGLHRDPDTQPNKLTLAEKEDRRRLFYSVLLKDTELATILNRRFTVLQMRNADTRLPLDIEDDQLTRESPKPEGQETRMTSLLVRMKFAQLAAQITDEVFGIQPVAYSRILELDSKIRHMQAEVPEKYKPGNARDSLTASRSFMIETLMLQELLRLHRPFFAQSYLDDKYAFSRSTCVKTAKRMLAVHSSPVTRALWPCMMFKGITAATVLCVDLMHRPDLAEREEHKTLIIAAAGRLERFKGMSTICRRGVALLRFLLAKIDDTGSFRSSEEDAPFLKRTRTTSVANSLPIPLEPSHTPVEPEPSRKIPSAALPSSLSLPAHLPLPAPASTDDAFRFSRPIHPLPPSRLQTTTSATATSPDVFLTSLSTFDPTPDLLVSDSSSFFDPPASLPSAANVIASLDFPALLGLEDAVSPFNFDLSVAPSASSGTIDASGSGASTQPALSETAVPAVQENLPALEAGRAQSSLDWRASLFVPEDGGDSTAALTAGALLAQPGALSGLGVPEGDDLNDPLASTWHDEGWQEWLKDR